MLRTAVVRCLAIGASSGGALAADAPPCPPQPGREVRAIAGEIAGEHDYREALGQGWTFVLARDAHGWNLRVLDAQDMDLTQLTPPYRSAPNPREIYGWHFRNADNTGPNDGSVNAPQRQRLFLISPGVSGTGGFKPSTDDAPDAEALAAEGRGALTILDYGLADLEQGQHARMVYLKFAACLSWPSTASDAAPAAALSAEDRETFGACGLREPYALEPYLSPPVQSGDFDGDGAHDVAATIVRRPDGKRGLAICRAGTWLHLVGIEGELGELTPAYFDRMDYWRIDPKTTAPASAAEEGPPPVLRGDAITIAMEEKSSVLLYWDGEAFRSYWQGD